MQVGYLASSDAESEALPPSSELQENKLLSLKAKRLNRKLWPAPWKMQEFLMSLILESALYVSDEQTVYWVKHLNKRLY